MEDKQYYMVSGQWKHGAEKLGVNLYRFDAEHGTVALCENVYPDITAGQLCADSKRDVFYVVDEVGSVHGDLGGGAYVYAFQIDRLSGHAQLLSKKRTISPYPCYMCLDRTGRYLIVSHNGDKGHVTRIYRSPDGTFTSNTVYDDTALVVFCLRTDGAIGDISDVFIAPSPGMQNPKAKKLSGKDGIVALAGVQSHLHSVNQSPDGMVTAACDMGMGRIYTFHMDTDSGKLILLDAFETNSEHHVRYSAFHPVMPYLFVNFESAPYILALEYDAINGQLRELCRVRSVPEGSSSAGGNDLTVDGDGKHLYCSNLDDTLSVFDIETDGMLTLKQNIPSGGVRPRTICLAPDGRFLIAGNNRSAEMAVFEVTEDGSLKDTGFRIDGDMPSGIKIF